MIENSEVTYSFRGGRMKMLVDLEYVSPGHRVTCRVKYLDGLTSVARKTVRALGKRMFIPWDGQKIFLDEPDVQGQGLLGLVEDYEDTVVGNEGSISMDAYFLGERKDIFLIFENVPYEISGWEGRAGMRFLTLNPLKAWKHNNLPKRAFGWRIFRGIREGDIELVYKDELGIHPYQAAMEKWPR